MKKILALVLVVLLSATLFVACSADSQTNADASTETTTNASVYRDELMKVVAVDPIVDMTYFVEVRTGIMYVAASIYKGGSLEQMSNVDGTPLLYEDWVTMAPVHNKRLSVAE